MSGICDTCMTAGTCEIRRDGRKLCTAYERNTNYNRLFGTPERAARTLAKACGECDDNLPCDECPLAPIIDFNVYELNLLEWLRGDAE